MPPITTLLHSNLERERENLIHALSDAEFHDLLDTPILGEEMSEHILSCSECLGVVERLFPRVPQQVPHPGQNMD